MSELLTFKNVVFIRGQSDIDTPQQVVLFFVLFLFILEFLLVYITVPPVLFQGRIAPSDLSVGIVFFLFFVLFGTVLRNEICCSL